MKCSRCGMGNANQFFCRGCGMRLFAVTEQIITKRELFPRTEFLKEVISLIEEHYPSDEAYSVLQQMQQKPELNMHDFVREDGVLIIDGYRLRSCDEKTMCDAFFKDIAITALIPLSCAVLVQALLGVSLIMTVKLYIIMFLLFSFVIWFLFPLLFESSPAALMLHNLIIIKGAIKRVRGEFASHAMLWILSMLYAFIPILILEFALYKWAGKTFIPFMFQIAGVKYLQKID